MASLNTQTRFVNIVIRKNDFKISERDMLIKQWCIDNCELYAYIYHKADKQPDTGEIEAEHCHIVATLKSVRRLSTTLSSLCTIVNLKTIGVQIDKINSYEGSLQYLLHKNDKQKTPHQFKEIIHNYDVEELKTILDSDSGSLTAERLYDIVSSAKTNYDIMKALGLNRYHNLRGVIKDLQQDIINTRHKNLKNLGGI